MNKFLFFILLVVFILSSLLIHKHKPKPQNNVVSEDFNNPKNQLNALQDSESESESESENEIEIQVFENNINKELNYVMIKLLDHYYYLDNKKYIYDLLNQFQINTIYDLSDKIINTNNIPELNNLLEKLTSRRNNGDIDYMNITDNINYKKILSFCKFLRIYTFTTEFIIKLINKEDIYTIEDFLAKKSVLGKKYQFEYIGLNHYQKKTHFDNMYYDIIEFLELNSIVNLSEPINLKDELVYDKKIKSELVKDINSIIVCLITYSIFDKTLIKNADFNETLFITLTKQINLNSKMWDTYYFKKYQIKNKIIDKLRN